MRGWTWIPSPLGSVIASATSCEMVVVIVSRLPDVGSPIQAKCRVSKSKGKLKFVSAEW